MGAAIAAGSQAEKGNWALLVKAPNISIIEIIIGNSISIFRFHEFVMNRIAIDSKIMISPIRFDRIVINPEADEEGFW